MKVRFCDSRTDSVLVCHDLGTMIPPENVIINLRFLKMAQCTDWDMSHLNAWPPVNSNHIIVQLKLCLRYYGVPLGAA